MSLSDAAKERVGQTVGGRIASEISNPGGLSQARQDRNDIATAASLRANDAADEAREYIAEKTESGSNSTTKESFEGDGVGASQNEEVAAFVNKQA
jgi:type IV secretion system protein VirB6/type IV secretion system protein TrbL